MKTEKYIDTVSGKELEKHTSYENGKIKNELYFLNGNFHREDGPAVI